MSTHIEPQSNCHPVRRPASASDLEMFSHLEQNLYTAVVADALDELGFHEQAMYPAMRPLSPDFRMAGWARTIRCEDVYHLDGDPYALEIEALDSFLAGEVAVVATGNSVRNAPWGELLSTAAKARGARGAVIAGLVRDVQKIVSLPFPVFATGIKPVDSRGRGVVRDYNCPVECGDVLVSPGDLVFADFDGVVVVPAEAVTETVRLATDKVSRENQSRSELMKGALLSEVYRKYGVL